MCVWCDDLEEIKFSSLHYNYNHINTYIRENKKV